MSIQTHWGCFPSSRVFSLAPAQIHVWRVAVEHPNPNIDDYRLSLSPEETTRTQRLKHPATQTRFVVTRGVLRKLLGCYLGVSPSDLQFAQTPEGKPYLQGPLSTPVQFNVTHTEGMALVAISGKAPVGIDVERADRRVQVEETARRFFSEGEANYLASVPETQRGWWFLTLWTCKEACLKMRGTGLGPDLRQWEIHLEPEGMTASVSGPSTIDLHSPISLWRINPGNGFVGAVAVGSVSPEISFYDWGPEISG